MVETKYDFRVGRWITAAADIGGSDMATPNVPQAQNCKRDAVI